jgi:hypothetical protein
MAVRVQVPPRVLIINMWFTRLDALSDCEREYNTVTIPAIAFLVRQVR